MADKFQLKALITGVDRLSPMLTGMRKKVAGFKKSLESSGLGQVSLSEAVTGGAAAAGLIAGVKAAIDFESAMADVKKVVNFDTPAQFAQMNRDVLQLSENLPMAATDIAKIVAAGGQSGIAKGELKTFATDAVKMGIAFDATAEKSGEMMAKWRTSFRLTQDQVVSLADKINYLSNNGPANAAQISGIVTRIGPLGEIAGLASGQIAAMGATLAGVGVEEEVAATGMKNFMLALTKGTSATKGQQKAWKALRLDAKALAVGMQKDAQGTIEDVLTRISKVDKTKQAGLLAELFGTESIGAIAPMLTNLESLKTNFRNVADATKYAGSMENEYASRSATTANSIQLLTNRLTAAGITVGAIFLPAINDIIKTVGPFISQIGALAGEQPMLIKGLIGAAIGFGILRVGVMAATAATALFSAVMTMTPLGLFLRGLALAVGIVVANWSTLAPYFQAFWKKIEAPAMKVWGMLKSFYEWTPIPLLIQNWGPITDLFSAIWDVVVALATPAKQFMLSLWDWSPLGMIVNNWEPIIGFFQGMWAKLKPIIEPMMELFKWGGGEEKAPEGEDVGWLKSATDKANAFAEQQRRSNIGVGGGTGAFIKASAVADSAAKQDALNTKAGIPSTSQLLTVNRPNMPAPGSLLQAGAANNKAQVDGTMTVRFENAPAGMRADPAKMNQPGLTVKPSVGYRSLGGANSDN